MSSNNGNYIYLYCITAEQPLLKNILNNNEKVYFIPSTGLYALVCDVPESEFSEENLERNLNDLDWLKRHVEKHERVIEEIMKNTSVIPLKFATVFLCRQNLEAFIEKYAGELNEKLEHVKNKEEWGVKSYCNNEKLKRKRAAEDTAVVKIEKEINSSSSGKAYLLNKKKIKLIENIADNDIDSKTELFRTRLEKLSSLVKVNEPLQGILVGRTGRMVLNTAFLVDKSNVPEFIEEVENLKEEFEDKGFAFEYTGPWPPYNFCGLSQK